MGRPSSRSAAPPGGEAGSDLLAFPRPSLAVDVAVLTVIPRITADSVEPAGPAVRGGRVPADRDAGADGPLDLAVLLLRRSASPKAGEWGLPGSFVRERERLDAAVLRTLGEKCGIEGLAPRQLHVFDDPARDDRGWVISVAHVDVVRAEDLADAVSSRDDLTLAPIVPRPGPEAHEASLEEPVVSWTDPPVAEPPGVEPVQVALPDGQRGLPFDHAEIVALAVRDLRDRYEDHVDPASLAGGADHTFTLLQLRRVHEAVLGRSLQKDTFRRQVIGSLSEVEGETGGTVGRPARIYRRKASDRTA